MGDRSCLRVELIAGADVDDGIRDAWIALAAAASTANIFYEHWAATAAAILPEAAGLMLLLAWDDHGGASPQLAGLLPLQPRKSLKGRVQVAVQNWDQRVRALGEPLIRSGFEAAFWAAALGFLDRQRGLGHFLRLSALDAASPSTRALNAVLATHGRPVHATRSIERALLRGNTRAADYVAANIRKKVLKEQRRLRNRLDEQGGLVFDRLGADADAAPWIDDLFRLEMTGWKGRDGVAAAADAITERCFRDLLTEAQGQGRLDFQRMRVGGKVIALLANIEAGDHAFQLKIAHDADYASFSPGVLLEMAYLDYALDVRKLAQVDSCARAGHPMIDRIWVDRLRIVSLAVPFDRRWSRLLCAAIERARRVHGRIARRRPATDS